MYITIEQLTAYSPVEKIVLHSYEGGLYNATTEINNVTYYISHDGKHPLNSRSIAELQTKLDGVLYENMVLTQESAYDEMIGLSTEYGQNRLEIPISKSING